MCSILGEIRAFCRENGNNPTIGAQKTHQNDNTLTTRQKLARLISSSNSAQDLRIFDTGKAEQCDCSSSNEATETCNRGSTYESQPSQTKTLRPKRRSVGKENLIGKGGYAEVYKGCLPDGQLVAIKRLNKGVAEEHVVNFLSEIGIIAHVKHPNTVRMVGYGVEGGAYLVLELSELGSLSSLLHSNNVVEDNCEKYLSLFDE
ncbi:Receptor-like cytosolic serine/threonine-protein kinase RBK2 [Sesamum alatum]|uniref:Receptor-like cytosolic serine/threonine-protein kinase RBK2 n=1 Tax=Sesamum alatum TaxID=300844 RepID=A0AAE1Y7K8_9LAMI|nr:Receptor-like cytosolic serine/threonine-protein kinase RBK2 [Sesamum alatum]